MHSTRRPSQVMITGTSLNSSQLNRYPSQRHLWPIKSRLGASLSTYGVIRSFRAPIVVVTTLFALNCPAAVRNGVAMVASRSVADSMAVRSCRRITSYDAPESSIHNRQYCLGCNGRTRAMSWDIASRAGVSGPYVMTSLVRLNRTATSGVGLRERRAAGTGASVLERCRDVPSSLELPPESAELLRLPTSLRSSHSGLGN